ncbi:hypothetical protein ACEWY4_024409 [Coilia grayii]|uniref:YqaJ viral recombinase domain-containing protein n=1 Tax=Coilia grayii TaxID=363190 RepID=A0ABD1J3E0_9TELE
MEAARAHAKAEAAKACTTLIQREAEVILAKARLEAELRTLQHKREVAAATAEAEILESAAAELELDERQSDIVALSVPHEPAEKRTSDYIDCISTHNNQLSPHQLKRGHISSTLPLLPRSCTGHTIQSTQIYSRIRIILTNQLTAYRKKWLTASNFGLVLEETLTFLHYSKLCLANTTSNKELLEYMERTGVTIQEKGVFLSDSGMLGGSPDGMVSNDCIIEVKCPYAARKKTTMQAAEAKDFFLQVDEVAY